MDNVCVVWLKRDLRLVDHSPLHYAVNSGKRVLLLWIYDNFMQHSGIHSERHLRFQLESVYDLNLQLQPFQTSILAVKGDAAEVFSEIMQHIPITEVVSNRESGTQDTFERDIKVKRLFQEKHVSWKEFPRLSIKRGSESRKNWSPDWEKQVRSTIEPIDLARASFVAPTALEAFRLNRLTPLAPQKGLMQPGGRTFALQYLNSFLEQRHRGYFRSISKPESARYHCSRLSAYLAWGNLSITEVWQHAQQALPNGSRRDLQQFVTRLKWQSHFVQKFETDIRLEFQNQNAAFNDIRQDINLHWVQAWKDGLTGYPLVDACMRCVAATGYLNFRMRAMVVSFLTHHLWQPWQLGAEWLGAQFLDFEPGIHFPQFQMQAACTGLHTVRIYEPIKQSLEHDAEAVFIRKWLPELATLPNGLVLQPHLLTPLEERMYSFRRGVDYPLPLVDTKVSGAKAGEILWKILKSQEAKREAARILKAHVVSPERQKAMKRGELFG